MISMPDEESCPACGLSCLTFDDYRDFELHIADCLPMAQCEPDPHCFRCGRRHYIEDCPDNSVDDD